MYRWSSLPVWVSGRERTVEIERPSTARRRVGIGMVPAVRPAHPPAKNAGRVGNQFYNFYAGQDGPTHVPVPKSQSSESKESLERFNRARDHFSDSVQGGNYRFAFEGKSLVEKYIRGRRALVLYCEVLRVEIHR